MNYVIEKNVPTPKVFGRGCSKYPFSQMQVGDSFVADKKARCAATNFGKRHGLKFSSRAEGDSIRIWRIE